MNPQEIRSLLKDYQLRATSTRMAVLRVLNHVQRPLSHSEMVQELKEAYGDQATIYRTLVKFVDVGLIRIASNVNGMARYEVAIKENAPQHTHPHFVCKACGIVSCLPKTTVITTVDDQWQEILRTAELQFLGFCPVCA